LTIKCASSECGEYFTPRTHNQKYHNPQCKREADKVNKQLEFEEKLDEIIRETGQGPKILLLDIETSPNLVYTWGLWDQNVGLNQIVETAKVICFSAKWLGDQKKKTMFFSTQDGHQEMIEAAWNLLDEADAVMHYNGTTFDIPHLNREFLEAKMGPPSPYKNVDLYSLSKKFKFQSRKLEHVSKQLGLEGKVQHEGFELWAKCLAGDAKAWKSMERYNRRDVTLMEDMYHELLPWIPNLPNRRLYNVDAGCPRCGSKHVQKRGVSRTTTAIFQQYQCQSCKGWFKDTHRSVGVNYVGLASC